MSDPGLGELCLALPTSSGTLCKMGDFFRDPQQISTPNFCTELQAHKACTKGGAGVGKIAQEGSGLGGWDPGP